MDSVKTKTIPPMIHCAVSPTANTFWRYFESFTITLFDKLLVYAILLFFASIINFLWLQIYCYKKFSEARFRFGWDKRMYKEMWNLTSWTMVGHVSLITSTMEKDAKTPIFSCAITLPKKGTLIMFNKRVNTDI